MLHASIVRILFVADVVGRSGRTTCCALLPRLRREEGIHFAIINAENVSGGAGVTARSAQILLDAGADVLTAGNHVWRRPKIAEFFARSDRLLRPANHHRSLPGSGCGLFPAVGGAQVGVVSVQGRVFMDGQVEHPFETASACVDELREKTPVVFVDFHAEATSEKGAMGRHLDGRASAVVGTHTHVQTADERILAGGTAFITDAGMTGPWESVIGVDPVLSLGRFLVGQRQRFEPAAGICVLEGVVVDVDSATGHAHAIRRLRRFYDPDQDQEIEP